MKLLWGLVNIDFSEHIANKFSSGRWIMVVCFTFATCVGFLIKLVPSEAFILLVGIIVKSYFERNDRQDEKQENGKEMINKTQ